MGARTRLEDLIGGRGDRHGQERTCPVCRGSPDLAAARGTLHPPAFQEKLLTGSFVRNLSHFLNISKLLNIFKQCCMCQTKHIRGYPCATFV